MVDVLESKIVPDFDVALEIAALQDDGRLQRVGRAALRGAIGVGAILAPFAPIGAAVGAVELAPPAQINNVGIDGLTAYAGVHFGRSSDNLDIAGPLVGLERKNVISILGEHIGVDVRLASSDIAILNPDGSPNKDTINVVGHLFSDKNVLGDELKQAAEDATGYYETIALSTGSSVFALELAAGGYLLYRRRQLAGYSPEARATIKHDRRLERTALPCIATLGVAALAAPLFSVAIQPNSAAHIKPSDVLVGTPVHDWQFTGALAPVIPEAVDAIKAIGQQEKSYYDAVTKSQAEAFKQLHGTDKLEKNPDIVRLVLMDDLQGVSGMARVIGEGAQLYSADAIINLGDLTATGTEQESYLKYLDNYTLTTLVHYAKKTPIYMSLGRHDTEIVAQLAKKLGVTVANGKEQHIAGIPIMGANSPYEVSFGQQGKLKDSKVTDDTVAQQLLQKACQTPVSLLIAHDVSSLGQASETGCLSFVVGGHSYTAKPSQNIVGANGQTTRELFLGSGGGHSDKDGYGAGLTTLRNTATYMTLSINKKTGEVFADTTTLSPDKKVTIVREQLATLSPKQLALYK